MYLKDRSGSKRCCFSSQAWVEPPEQSVIEVPLAQTGEGIAECELLRWFVQEVRSLCITLSGVVSFHSSVER